MKTTNIAPDTRARRIFRQLGIQFEDLDDFSELLSDIQTSLAVSLHENFSHLPKRTDPKYGEAVSDGILTHELHPVPKTPA
jgi:hypothetical protein